MVMVCVVRAEIGKACINSGFADLSSYNANHNHYFFFNIFNFLIFQFVSLYFTFFFIFVILIFVIFYFTIFFFFF